AIHEAGHSVVAHALGIKFGKRGVTIIPSKNGRSAGLVQTVKLSRHSMTDNIAHILAGGMAGYRVTPKQTEELNSLCYGKAGDVSHIASDLTYDVLVQENRKGRRFNGASQTAF